jgi:hypothetical protein
VGWSGEVESQVRRTQKLGGHVRGSTGVVAVTCALGLYAALAVWLSRSGRGPGLWWTFGGVSLLVVIGLVLVETATRPVGAGAWRPTELLALVVSLSLLVTVPLLACTAAVRIAESRELSPLLHWVIALVAAALMVPVGWIVSATAGNTITGSAL